MTSHVETAFQQKKRIAALWLFAILSIAVMFFSQPMIDIGSQAHEFIEISGLMLVFIAVLGRLWSILYVGAHKNKKLITAGPYSMTRNPLYFFSMVGITGVGLMFGSLLFTVILTTACLAVFRYTAEREAAFLRSKFGTVYEDYAASTPMLIPKPSLYQGPSEITFSSAALATTFFDSLFLFALLPLFEGLEALQQTGYLTPVLFLP